MNAFGYGMDPGDSGTSCAPLLIFLCFARRCISLYLSLTSDVKCPTVLLFRIYLFRIFRIKLAAFLAASMEDEKKSPSPKTFSFVEPCLRSWERHRVLRQRAIKMQRLLISSDSESPLLPPTLENIKLNYKVLKGYTEHMANTGVILTVHMKYLKPPIVEFYKMMEIDVTDRTCERFCHATATCIKKMLHVIKRKWSKPEMPRVPGPYCKFVLFFFPLSLPSSLQCRSSLG